MVSLHWWCISEGVLHTGSVLSFSFALLVFSCQVTLFFAFDQFFVTWMSFFSSFFLFYSFSSNI
jgi:hypothetical protein